MQEKMAILVGGGPAPGINSVIGAATIRARVQGIEVLGIRDGFEWIMQGDIDHAGRAAAPPEVRVDKMRAGVS